MAKIINPYRSKSKNAKVFGAVLGSKKPIDISQVAKRARLPIATVQQVLSALMNPIHNSVGRRAGVAVVRKGDGFVVKRVKAEPKAKRTRKVKKTKRAKLKPR